MANLNGILDEALIKRMISTQITFRGENTRNVNISVSRILPK